MLLLTNQFLHIFGWALTVEIDDDGNVTKFYPAYCKFRGFDYEIHDWAANNMNWDEVVGQAIQVTQPNSADYDDGRCNGEWEVVTI